MLGSIRFMFVASLFAAILATKLENEAVADAELPTGLAAGSKYQIMFMTTDGTTASSSNIATYNSFVTAQAKESPTLGGLRATWTAIVSTPTFSASNATNTTNVPIYDTRGDLLASSFPALRADPDFLGPAYDQLGKINDQVWVWTGCWLPNGSLTSSYQGHTLSTSEPIWGYDIAAFGDFHTYNQGWLCDDAASQNGYSDCFYALSSPITVVPEPASLMLLGSATLGLALVFLAAS